jgi:hypothetical protein
MPLRPVGKREACRASADLTLQDKPSPEFLLVDLVNELGDLAKDRDAVLLAFAKKLKRWIRESLHGQFLSTALLHAEKVSGDIASCRPRRHLASAGVVY